MPRLPGKSLQERGGLPFPAVSLVLYGKYFLSLPPHQGESVEPSMHACIQSCNKHLFKQVLNTRRASHMAQWVKKSPVTQETWVRSLGWEDSWRRARQPTPVFLPGASPWTEEPGQLQSMGSERVRHDWSKQAHMPIPGTELDPGGTARTRQTNFCQHEAHIFNGGAR